MKICGPQKLLIEETSAVGTCKLQLGCLSVVGDGVDMCQFIVHSSLPCKYGINDNSRLIDNPGIQKASSRADEVPDPTQRCACAPVFKMIKSNPVHNPSFLSSVSAAPNRIFLALEAPRRMKCGGNCSTKFVRPAGGTDTGGGR